MYAPVAQGIEQGLPKPRVGGSIPPRRVFNDGARLPSINETVARNIVPQVSYRGLR